MKNLTEIHVVGGKSLAGNISIQGSKNAALPMMAAALMHRGLSILKGLYQCGQNRDTRGIYQKNAFFRYSPVSNTGTKPQLQNGVPGRLRHRKKTYRYSPDGIKEAGSRYPGGKIRT